MQSNLTPVYVLLLLGAFSVGLVGTVLAARSLAPVPASPASRVAPPKPATVPVPASHRPFTVEC